jgi:hypothetical protein
MDERMDGWVGEQKNMKYISDGWRGDRKLQDKTRHGEK